MLFITHDNNSEILAEIRKAKTVERVHQLATELGLVASHTFDMNWIALAESPNGTDIFMARNTDGIEYKGVVYPLRTFDVRFIDEENYIMIAPQSLSDALGDKKEELDTEEELIDCDIYFYVEDDKFGLDGEDICKNHLDIEIEFIIEIFE